MRVPSGRGGEVMDFIAGAFRPESYFDRHEGLIPI